MVWLARRPTLASLSLSVVNLIAISIIVEANQPNRRLSEYVDKFEFVNYVPQPKANQAQQRAKRSVHNDDQTTPRVVSSITITPLLSNGEHANGTSTVSDSNVPQVNHDEHSASESSSTLFNSGRDRGDINANRDATPADDTINIDFEAKGRVFKLRLKPDITSGELIAQLGL